MKKLILIALLACSGCSNPEYAGIYQRHGYATPEIVDNEQALIQEIGREHFGVIIGITERGR